MNNVTLIGRLTKDPQVNTVANATGTLSIARFTLAIGRKGGKDAGADFPSCVAFGKTAELISKYLKKGSKIAVSGRIQTGSYDKQDGTKVYTTDVIVEEFEFCEKAQASTPGTPVAAPMPTAPMPAAPTAPAGVIPDGFSPMADDDDLPFV